MRYDDPQWLDRMYNNRERVPEHGQHFARWARESAFAREAVPCRLDIPYGDTPGQTLDVFAAAQPDSPVMVFIHGGYWRSLDKREHAFVAPPFVREGACVVVPNYDLCPAVTIPQIVLQMTAALAWTWHHAAAHGGDASRITVVGHSAGGHLAAMLLACDWKAVDRSLPADLVTRALALSGLYDLEPLMHTPFVQPSLQLNPEDVQRASPAWLPAPAHATLYAVAGGKESMEFIRQNQLIRRAWGTQCVPVCEAVPGLDHFSILEALAEPGHRLHQYALALLHEHAVT